jgi:DNA-binding GntR family transcriptional regulator
MSNTDRTPGMVPMSPAVVRDTTSQRTEVVLRNMILDGTIAPGQRLNEVALAASLGISRGPLREAVQRLASEGLLTVVSHRGAFVRTFERREIVELYDVRAALELHAVRLVCRNSTDEDLEDLTAMLDETETRIRQSSGHAYPAELDFHLRLVMLAGNQELMSAALGVHHQLSLARSMSAKRPLRARAAVVEHQTLVDAMRARDVHGATELMEAHIEHSRDSALTALGLPTDDPSGQMEENE